MNFEISHAVDDSDVAFVMRLDRKSTVCSIMSSRSTHYHKVGTNIDAFINLPTLNYLLAGLQLCYVPSHPGRSKWFDLLHDLDQERYAAPGFQLTLWDLRYVIRDLVVPFGVVRGSEKQGGQDETGFSPATFPVNFVTNMVLDGHERNVVNYWHYHDVSAGDDLVFRLKPMPLPTGKSAYTLNHYYKGFVQQNFESYTMQRNLGHPHANHVWQLVPDIFSLECKPENDGAFGEAGVIMSPGFEVPHDYVWQEHGYWHVARSQVMFRKYAQQEYYNDDMANQLKVNHLDLTFEPAYCKAPGETRDPTSNRAVRRDNRGDRFVPDGRRHVSGVDGRSVLPGLYAQPAYRPWKPELVLEGAAMPGAVGRDVDPHDAAGCDVAMHDLDSILAPRQPLAPAPEFARPASRERRVTFEEPARPVDFSVMFTDPPEMPPTVAAAASAVDPQRPAEIDGEPFSLVFSDDPPPVPAPVRKNAGFGKKRKPDQDPA